MKRTVLIALGIATHAACTTEEPVEDQQVQAIDSDTEDGSLDGYTGRTYDAESLPAKLVTGDLVRHGSVSALVPDPGESVYAEGLRHGAIAEELEIEVDDDGTVHVDADAASAENAALVDAAATASKPCEDTHHDIANFTWDTTLHYTFKASSTPAYLPVTVAEEAIRQGGLNIVNANNSCGRADHVSATIHYDGRTSRGVNITPAHVCGKRDGHSVVAFGDFDDPSLWGYTCVWKRKQYVPGSGATLRFGVESDIRLQKTAETWWQGEHCDQFAYFYVDLENVMTHERGHSFGLKHVDSYYLTMYPYTDYCERRKRTLGLGDMLGLEILY